MDTTGSTIHDHDPPTAMVVGGTAALNTAGGAALIAMSSTFHVTLGAIFLASGVFLFSWLITRKAKHERLLALYGYDKDQVKRIVDDSLK